MISIFSLFLATLAILNAVVSSSVNISFQDSVKLLGRTRMTDKSSIQTDWPATGVEFQFLATSEVVTMNALFQSCGSSCHYYIGLDVNCARQGKYEISSNSSLLSTSIAAEKGKVYEISLRKVTEAACGDAYGVLELMNIEINGGIPRTTENYQEICPRKKKLLVFGDSFTAAYGVDELSPCDFAAATEDVTHGYAYLVAQDVQADVHIVAWSGKGAVRNYGDSAQTSPDPLPTYYNRTLGTKAVAESGENYWEPKNYSPDLVIVMLGTNDYSTSPQPSDDQFISGLSSFISTIQADYKAKVLALCAPGSPAIQCQNIAKAAAISSASYFAIPDAVWEGGSGCSGHPYVTTQQNMAAAILPTVQSLLL